MKKIQKLIVIFTAISVLIFAMAACDDNTTDSSDVEKSSSSVNSEETSREETVVDHFPDLENPDLRLITHAGTKEQHDTKKAEDGVGNPFYYQIELFEQKYGGNVKVSFVPYDQIVGRLINMQAANDAPDLMILADQTYPLTAAVGALQPVDEIEGFDRSIWDEEVLEAFKFRGKYYGLAAAGDNSQAHINLIIYNKTMFEENMVDLPSDLFDAGEWTFENFARVARALTQDTNSDGEYDTRGYSSWGTIPAQFAYSNGTRFMSIVEEGYKSNLDDSKMVETFRFLAEWFAPPESGGFIDLFQVSNFDAAFRDGKIAMVQGIAYPDDLPFEIGAVPFPKGPSNPEGLLYSNLYGYGIPTGAKNPIGAKAFMHVAADNEVLEEEYKISTLKSYGKPEEAEVIYEKYLKPGLMGDAFKPIYAYEFAISDVWGYYWNVMVDLSSGNTAANIAATQHEALQATLSKSYGDID